MAKGRLAAAARAEDNHMDFDEGVSGGLCYSDSAGIHLQVHFLLYLFVLSCFTMSSKLLNIYSKAALQYDFVQKSHVISS